MFAFAVITSSLSVLLLWFYDSTWRGAVATTTEAIPTTSFSTQVWHRLGDECQGLPLLLAVLASAVPRYELIAPLRFMLVPLTGAGAAQSLPPVLDAVWPATAVTASQVLGFTCDFVCVCEYVLVIHTHSCVFFLLGT